VKQIDAGLGEASERLVKRATKERRERGVIGSVVGVNFVKNLLSIKPRMLIALPSIHGEAAARNRILQNGLAEAKIGFAEMRSQLNESGRA
jgi:orotidine-5'-phosphate decarboxylase